MEARYLTRDEIEERLAQSERRPGESLQAWDDRRTAASIRPRWYTRPVPLGWFLAVAGALFLGLLLLAGFAFHEAGIITPLDGMYEWAHTTFGGMEEAHPVGGWLWFALRPDGWMW